MWPVIRRTSVPPTEMSKDRRPQPQLSRRRRCTPRMSPVGAPHNSITWLIPLFIEWSAAPVHRRCLTDCHRQRCSDDRRIPPPGAWSPDQRIAGAGDPPSGAGRVKRRHP
jgi:hypothetical protein